MKRLFNNKFLFIILIFMSFSLPGSSPTNVIAADTNIPLVLEVESIQDSLYQERIKNINRLEQMKYVVHKMAE